jgi:hypothetical protein
MEMNQEINIKMNIQDLKKIIERDDKDIKLERLINLFHKYGESEDNFIILDQVIIDLAVNPRQAANRVASGNYQVMYQYKLRDGISGSTIIATTRDFCRGVISAKKLYTRDEINTMSQREGRDVFTLTGGFYHNPETGQTTNYCRHSWFQVLAKRK